MAEYIVKDTELTSIANAIRAKSGGNSQLEFPNGFVSEIGSIGGNLRWELIGEKTFELEEYTAEVNETTNTEINIRNTDYAYILTIVTCDSIITTNNEWGMTIALGGRYTSNNNYANGISYGQKGSSTLSKSAMTTNSWGQTSGYGVKISTNTGSIVMERKAHSTGCPKIRGGTYKVSVYGLAGI